MGPCSSTTRRPAWRRQPRGQGGRRVAHAAFPSRARRGCRPPRGHMPMRRARRLARARALRIMPSMRRAPRTRHGHRGPHGHGMTYGCSSGRSRSRKSLDVGRDEAIEGRDRPTPHRPMMRARAPVTGCYAAASRQRRQRSRAPRRPASARRARPSGVRAPVEAPPCIRHRVEMVPSERRQTGATHGAPPFDRQRAPHRGRSLFRSRWVGLGGLRPIVSAYASNFSSSAARRSFIEGNVTTP